MDLKVLKLKNCLPELARLAESLEKEWLQQEGAQSIKGDLMDKAKALSDLDQGLILFDGKTPLGFALYEVSTPFYGNVTFYAIEDAYEELLAQAAAANGYFDDKIMEVVMYRKSPNYRRALRALGFIENERQRMFRFLDKQETFDVPHLPYTLRPITANDIQICGEMSCRAHHVSKDYEMYCEMMVPHMRVGLERKVHNGDYGPIIFPASLAAFDGDKMVGYILHVDVKCWGYDKVPWVFDIVVEPALHGQKIGTFLMMKSMEKLAEMNYPVMGLAVTLNNYGASYIYEKMGYQIMDVFHEFIRPVTPW